MLLGVRYGDDKDDADANADVEVELDSAGDDMDVWMPCVRGVGEDDVAEAVERDKGSSS